MVLVTASYSAKPRTTKLTLCFALIVESGVIRLFIQLYKDGKKLKYIAENIWITAGNILLPFRISPKLVFGHSPEPQTTLRSQKD